jgi:hypothetical protein
LDATLLWAQVVPGTDPRAVQLMALRRWFAGLTLCSPEAYPSRFGLWAWLAGLGALLLLALAVQGPLRAIRQLLDVPGHARVAVAALGRLRRSARAVAVLLGAAVLSWTGWQFRFFASQERLEDLAILLKTRSVGEVAAEQGLLAALTPLRDLCGLGDTLVLLVAASVVVFKLSADRWGSGIGAKAAADALEMGPAEGPPPWTTFAWGGAWLYALYRLAGHVLQPGGLPPASCLVIESAVVPPLMLLADALVLAWVLLELRQADAEPTDGGLGPDVAAAVALIPGAALACLAALPARYAAVFAWLVPEPLRGVEPLGTALRGLIPGRGLIVLQAGSLALLGVAGVVALGRGRWVAGVFRLLRAEGGRLVAAVAGASAAAGCLSAAAYAAVLSLPAQPWVLNAADSYAHYATLPLGLLLLATLVELASRALPAPPPSAEGLPVPEEAEAQAAGFDLA